MSWFWDGHLEIHPLILWNLSLQYPRFRRLELTDCVLDLLYPGSDVTRPTSKTPIDGCFVTRRPVSRWESWDQQSPPTIVDKFHVLATSCTTIVGQSGAKIGKSHTSVNSRQNRMMRANFGHQSVGPRLFSVILNIANSMGNKSRRSYFDTFLIAWNWLNGWG